MALMWRLEDVPALARLARIWDRALAGEASAAELGEARQLEDRYGLSPQARRRLGWVIVEDAGPVVAPAPSSEVDARILDLQRRLDGGAA